MHAKHESQERRLQAIQRKRQAEVDAKHANAMDTSSIDKCQDTENPNVTVGRSANLVTRIEKEEIYEPWNKAFFPRSEEIYPEDSVLEIVQLVVTMIQGLKPIMHCITNYEPYETRNSSVRLCCQEWVGNYVIFGSRFCSFEIDTTLHTSVLGQN